MLTQGPAPDPSVTLLFHHSLHFHIYWIVSFLLGMPCPLYCYQNWWGNGPGGGQLIYIKVWVGGRGQVSCYSFCLFVVGFFFFLMFLYFVVSRSQSVFLKWLEHDGCCVCFFVFLYFFSLVPLSRSYQCRGIVVPVIIILWISLEKGECFDFNHS